MKNVNYSTAYAEVIEVLRYIPIEDYHKIPKKFITFMEENCDENNTFIYNLALPFHKQELSAEAKNILATIYRLFWANENEKIRFNKIDNQLIIQKNQEMNVKYNPDNIFKKRNSLPEDIDRNHLEENNQLIPYKKESWIQKLFKKIKDAFKK